MSRPHTQVVVVGEDERAGELLKAAREPFLVNKSVVHLTDSEAVVQNLPAVLAETIPNLPGLKEKKSMAVVCTNFTCLPPLEEADQLAILLRESLNPAT
jgi:uncharacterized protein YyaL (SSP411 family)